MSRRPEGLPGADAASLDTIPTAARRRWAPPRLRRIAISDAESNVAGSFDATEQLS